MKTKKQPEANTVKLPKGFVIDENLNEKRYEGQPFFKKKSEQAKHILKIAPLPKL
ncbi:hypothetical protein [Foetidibacter luteolus]|uniref:hypothetical protein n=1 Tax=Foetidibacter luteolus TaxID=2608880 RepID=UPI00129B4812|nr:hypothetical protein [Foetidibacter luteolus]